MSPWQYGFLILFIFYSMLGFLFGFKHCRKKRFCNESYIFYPLGAFVWADAVIFGIFWVAVTSVTLFLRDFLLFLSFYFLFWTVRNFGETLYWFNHQFTTIKRYPIKSSWAYKFFEDEYTCMFVYQILWQCLTVISLFFAILFTYQWLVG